MRGKFIGLLVVIAAAIGVAGYLYLQRQAQEPLPAVPVAIPPKAPAASPAAPAPAAEAPIRYPIAPQPSEQPLPELGSSDAPLLEALAAALGKKWLAFIVPDGIIHRFVATVDNLPRPKLPAAIVPVKRVAGTFFAAGKDDTLAVDARNSARYLPIVKLVRPVDAAKLVAVYRKFYPLFQRAYVELGYPQGNFNDRLVAAIDDLLGAPEVDEPIALTQPKVLYEFADADLAQRSSGQKILLRMGRENAAVVKAKLREIRELVVHG